MQCRAFHPRAKVFFFALFAVFLLTLALDILVAPRTAQAQPPGKVYRIGYIAPGAGPSVLTETFRQGLRDLGYVEGQNLAIEYRWTGRGERLAELMGELVGLKPDLIVTVSHRVSLVAKRATSTIPIVFAAVNDPVGVGLVPSLAHPGGNVTGLSAQGLDLIAKRLELVKELVPSAVRIAYLGNPEEPYSPVYLREAQDAARGLGLEEVFALEARTNDDFDAVFATLTARRPHALLVEPNSLNGSNRGRIMEFALANHLPTMYGLRSFVDGGGLVSYGPEMHAHFKRLASYVDKILRGTRPSDLPVEQPMKFELIINGKTAEALGLTIPPALLMMADEVLK
jgi:putative tryptophan/tyrosine transport system substrate-binding protein